MFCKNCGKEISDKAIMCPFCGCSTKEITRTDNDPNDVSAVAMAPIALFLALFALVTGVTFGALFFSETASIILVYILGASTILPALASISLGIATLSRSKQERDRILAITAIILAGIVLLFLLVSACYLVTNIL